MSANIKRWVRWIGGILGLLGVVFVAYRLVVYFDQISFQDWRSSIWVGTAALAALYAAFNFMLALGWRNLIRDLGYECGQRWCIRVYADTQLAKYLPGNIFHYAGRQALGMDSEIPQASILLSSILEITVISLVAACFTPLVVPLLWPVFTNELAAVVFLTFISIGTIILLVLKRRFLYQAVLAYGGYVVFSASIFVGVFVLVGGAVSSFWELVSVAAAFTISWLAGLLMPGAPAGLGVRESALLLLLGGVASEPTLLSAVVLGRIVTTLGDLLFYLFGRRA